MKIVFFFYLVMTVLLLKTQSQTLEDEISSMESILLNEKTKDNFYYTLKNTLKSSTNSKRINQNIRTLSNSINKRVLETKGNVYNTNVLKTKNSLPNINTAHNSMNTILKAFSKNSQSTSTKNTRVLSGKSKPNCLSKNDKKDNKTEFTTKNKEKIIIIKEKSENDTEHKITNLQIDKPVEIDQDKAKYIFKGNYNIDKLVIEPEYNSQKTQTGDTTNIPNPLPALEDLGSQFNISQLPQELQSSTPWTVFWLFILVFVLFTVIIIMFISICLLFSYFNLVFAIHHFKTWFLRDKTHLIQAEKSLGNAIDEMNKIDYIKFD